jgi:hypothetical protein
VKFASAPRPHSSCTVCHERRTNCIYRFFGPCKFDEEATACQEAVEAEQAAELKEKEITQRQLDQSQLVLLDDQMLAADVEDMYARLDKLL